MRVYADRKGFLYLSLGPSMDFSGNIWWMLEDDLGTILCSELNAYEDLGEL